MRPQNGRAGRNNRWCRSNREWTSRSRCTCCQRRDFPRYRDTWARSILFVSPMGGRRVEMHTCKLCHAGVLSDSPGCSTPERRRLICSVAGRVMKSSSPSSMAESLWAESSPPTSGVKGFNALSLGMTVGLSAWVYVRARQRETRRGRAFVVEMEKSETKSWGMRSWVI